MPDLVGGFLGVLVLLPLSPGAGKKKRTATDVGEQVLTPTPRYRLLVTHNM